MTSPFARPSAAEPEAPPRHVAADGGERLRGGSDLAVVARGGLLNLIGAGSNGLFTFLLFVVVARSLATEEVGAFLIAIAAFTILSTAVQLGANVGLVRMVSRYRVLDRVGDIRATLLIGLLPVLLASSALALALYLFAPVFFGVFGRGESAELTVRYLRLLAPFLPFSATTMVLANATQGFGTMLPAVVVDKAGRAGLQLSSMLLTAGLGGVAVAWSWAGPFVVACALLTVWLLLLLRRAESAAGAGRTQPAAALADEFWRFSAPRGVASLFQVTVLWLDTILLGALRSTTEAGIYSVTTRYLVIGHLAIGAVLQVMGPKISELLAREDSDRAQALHATVTWWLIALVWPVYLTLAVFAPFLLQVFGPEFVAGRTALVILAIAMMIAAACGPVDVVLLMGGRSWLSLVNWGMALVVNVALNLVLIPPLGIDGAAIAWMVSILVRNVVPLVEVWALMGLHPFGDGFWRVTAGAVLCFGALGLLVRLGFGTSAVTFAVYAAVATSAYAVLLWRNKGVLLRGAAVPGSRVVVTEA